MARYEYTAERVITCNGVRAYNPGDPVPASAVSNLGLTVGVDVSPARDGVLAQPGPGDSRAAWEVWWLAHGVDRAVLDDMSRDQLASFTPHPHDGGGEGGGLEPPGRGARKADWVAYAVARGMPLATAEESTIDQLAGTDYDLLFGPQ